MHNVILCAYNKGIVYSSLFNENISAGRKVQMNKVFIDGAHGTTGLEIRERLCARDDIEILDIDESMRKDLGARVEAAKQADVTIMCLPDAASVELAENLPDDVRVIDTSTAHRVNDSWVYGMPELFEGQRDLIRSSSRVANPGCHATGFILLVRPLVDAGLIKPDQSLSCFCVTGYSGGGRKMIENYEKNGPFTPGQYAIQQSHKHLPEMVKMTGLTKEPLFCPVVGDYYRGMVMTVELPGEALTKAAGVSGIRELYESRYESEPLIGISDVPEGGFIYSDTMSDSDRYEIIVGGNDDRILLISRFDNLGKGASGAAVQNLNLMLGEEETLGLRI